MNEVVGNIKNDNPAIIPPVPTNALPKSAILPFAYPASHAALIKAIVILIISKTVTTIAIIFVKKIALSLPIFRHLYAQKATISKNIINVTM